MRKILDKSMLANEDDFATGRYDDVFSLMRDAAGDTITEISAIRCTYCFGDGVTASCSLCYGRKLKVTSHGCPVCGARMTMLRSPLYIHSVPVSGVVTCEMCSAMVAQCGEGDVIAVAVPYDTAKACDII